MEETGPWKMGLKDDTLLELEMEVATNQGMWPTFRRS